MRYLSIAALVVAAFTGCQSVHHFPDEHGSNTWVNVTVSEGSSLPGHSLSFVGVTKDGVLTMKYVTDRTYLVSGKPGEFLTGECGNTGYKVVSVSTKNNEAVISYIGRSTFPTY